MVECLLTVTCIISGSYERGKLNTPGQGVVDVSIECGFAIIVDHARLGYMTESGAPTTVKAELVA